MSTNQFSHQIAANVAAVPPPAAISDEVRAAADRLGVGRYLADETAFTLEIFGSFLDLQVVPDPEVPDFEHIVFAVPVTGNIDELLDKDRRWSRRLLTTIPKTPRVFAIDMDYQE